MTLKKIRSGPSRLYPGLTVLHAAKGGGPVLAADASWRTVNGLMLGTNRGLWAWTFRRSS
jgi:hypothetical protein